MCKRMIYVVSLVMMLSVAGSTSADLVAHWPLDDGSGTVAVDVTGNGNDGTLNGDPQWVAGKIGGGLEFDGDDFVDCGNQDILNFGTNDWTITAWIRTTQPDPDRGTIFANGSDNSGGIRFTLATHEANPNHITLTTDDNSTKTQALGATVVIDGEWYHIAGMRQGTTISVHVNGVLDGTNTIPATIDFSGSSQSHAYLGAIDGNSDPAAVALEKIYIGVLDDIRIYNVALSEDELQATMEGTVGFPYALGPDPADGALIADTWVNLSWRAGDFAVSHDVYLGEDSDEVSNATPESDVFRGNQTATFYVAGFPGFAYPDGLVPGTTYYWRIDEVNEADPNSPWVGPVWSFSIPPKTAYNPDPADNAESIGPEDVTLSWTAGYGAKLHTVYIGNDYDEVNNAAGGAMQGSTTYNAGSLEAEKVYYWRVDEFDAVQTYKGEIWTFTTPGAVGTPQPADGAVGAAMTTTLSWMPATNATSHQVYLGLDKDAVRNADTGAPEYQGSAALGSESLDPGKLAWQTMYFWRVDAVTSAGTVKGPIWSFTTADFIAVEDFESYTDDDVAGEAIWQTWIDGFGIADNGAQAGYLVPPYCEQSIVHGGLQSMPLLYTNEAGVTNSEATLTLTTARDWTEEGVGELSLWFRGSAANAADPLYVAISNTAGAPAVVAYDDPTAAQKGSWTPWVIPLQTFADQGINLVNVDKIAIGLGSKSGMAAAGGTGTMYIDDIRLYRP
jgi:hypothetical protein